VVLLILIVENQLITVLPLLDSAKVPQHHMSLLRTLGELLGVNQDISELPSAEEVLQVSVVSTLAHTLLSLTENDL